MSKAIIVKFLPHTEHKPSRLKASAEGVGSVTLSYDNSNSRDERYHNAVRALCEKAGWTGVFVNGQIPNGDEVFVFDHPTARFTVGESPRTSNVATLLEAIAAALPDLEHYANTHGPGPDRRLLELRAALKAVYKEMIDAGEAPIDTLR